jgi:hypothetical protein
MSQNNRTPAQLGIMGGLLLFLHGLFPNTHAYPLIWPVLAGAVTLWIAASAKSEHRVWHSIKAVLSTGLISALVALPLFVGALFLLMRVLVRPRAA